MVVELRKRMRNGLTLNTNVTWARSYDMSNNYSGAPNDQRFPEREFAPSADTPVWRIVSSGTYDISPSLQASAIYRGRGGYAFDPRSGATFDLNGDGVFNDRTPTLERNSFRGPDTHMLDTRFAYTIRRGKQQRLQLAVEAFNLLNRDNVRARADLVWAASEPAGRGVRHAAQLLATARGAARRPVRVLIARRPATSSFGDALALRTFSVCQLFSDGTRTNVNLKNTWYSQDVRRHETWRCVHRAAHVIPVSTVWQ